MRGNAPEMLKQFFGAYFHEDWTEEVSTSDEAITAFIADGQRRKEELSWMADVIDAYMAKAGSEEALKEGLLMDLGCYYLPNADGYSVRTWLEHVAQRLRTAAAVRG